MSIILASTSASRRAMLEAAGVAFEAVGSQVDEDAVKTAMVADGATVRAIADRLAEAKAVAVSAARPGAWVVGSDSMVALDDRRFLDKPGTPEGLRAQLRRLRGRDHALVSAVAVARDGVVAWRHVAAATLRVRDFSDAWAEDYVAACGQEVVHSVGGYHLEGLGVQLFDRVEGDGFAIRGLPLVPLLRFLRSVGAMPA